ncbi:hypothetical protein GGI00_000016 [Coemansia sp. RSA 2681]|nr:hypothetical protein GGI00_000016 [Coemansia sp. RSA 2681]
MQLDERLAEFESDIAELSTEPNTAVPNTAVPIGDEDDDADFLSSINEEVELEQQSEMWRQRTDKLLHLRSIIKEGIRDMDLSESKPLMSSDVVMKDGDSSDSEEEEEEEDFSELMNWKSSSI